MKKKHLFIIAGEPSGDLHGAHLVKALRNLSSEYHFSGVAGPCLRAENVETIMPMEKFMVMGFSDVIKTFPSLYRQFYALRDHILKFQPAGVLFVDYPGFNLRMAKALRKAGYAGQLIHYISPSVWAWGKKRIVTMAETLNLLLTIYPFEIDCFSHTPLKVQYVGNPLQENMSEYVYEENWKKQSGLTHTYIAIFPGSRRQEVERNLPKQLQAAAQYQKKHSEIAFGISCAHPDLQPIIEDRISKEGISNTYIIPSKYTYELMRDCHSAIAKSGTVTLELALHRRPTVVVYELSFLNWLIAKFLIRPNLSHYCIVNILSNKRVFPELIEKGFNKENLLLQLENIHEGPIRENCIKDCEKIAELFYQSKASDNAAQAIESLFQKV